MPEVQTLCVVWSRPDREVPGEMLALLQSRRGVRLQRTGCAYDALARVLRQSREDDLRPTSAALPRTPIVLLMVEPAGLDLAAPTHEAARRFAPHASCWQYDARGAPNMRPIDDAESREWSRSDRTATHPPIPATPVEPPEDVRRRTPGFVPGAAVPGTATRGAAARTPLVG